jgi:multiple sugar transport system substrate-binding protein
MVKQALEERAGSGLHGATVTRRALLGYGVLGAGAALAAPLLASCGAGSTGGGSTSGGSKVVLDQWYHQYGEAGTLQAAQGYATRYAAANKNVEARVSWIPGDYLQKLSAALLTSSGPDVFENYVLDATAVEAGQLATLDDLFTPDVRARFDPKDIQAFTLNGHVYGVKMVTDVYLMYYRKSMLSRAGLGVPQTFDQFVSAARKLGVGGTKGAYLGNDGGLTQLPTVVDAAGGELVTPGGKIGYDTDRVVHALEQLRDLNNSGALLLGAPTDWFDPGSFIGGLTAMQWGGLWMMPAVKKAFGGDFVVGPWPSMGSSGRPSTSYTGWWECVNARSRHVREAKAFVKSLWIDDTKDQSDFNLAYGFHVPPETSVRSRSTQLQSGEAARAVKIGTTYGFVQSPYYTSAVAQPLTDAALNVIKKGADARTAVHDAATRAQQELDKIHKG